MTSATPAERRVARVVLDELNRQYQSGSEGPYTYLGLADADVDIDTTDDFDVGVDGHIDLLQLVRALSRSSASLPEDPPEHGRSVLVQYKLETDFTTITCQDPAWYDHSREIWVLERQVDHPYKLECWWEYPELLSQEELQSRSAQPEATPDPMPDAVALYLLEKVHGGTCPKCREQSGNSWASCRGSCPVPGSPDHSAAETLRQLLPAAGKLDR